MIDPAARAFLRSVFEAAVAAALPSRCIAPHLPAPPVGRTVVVGAGKAAAAMALAVEEAWPEVALSGLVITRYGHGAPCRRIEVVEADHPLPDAAGQMAARRLVAAVGDLTSDDLVLCLLSGGGSALMTLPAPGVPAPDKRALTRDLLASGASIAEINTVRKHLSAIKGGRLALAAAPARLVTLAISDVPGDDVAVIASGPTVGDPTAAADARAVLARHGINPSPAIDRFLATPDAETPKPDDPRLADATAVIVARAQDALAAAADHAAAAGVPAAILGDAIEGEAREVARVIAGIAHQVRRHHQPWVPPCLLLSGGETTVTVRTDTGRGGRNTEFLLALALALDGAAGVYALAADTDGIDGTEPTAGAVITPDTLARCRAAGIDPADALARSDSATVFEALDDQVMTGPTRTNINDLRAVLII